MSSYPLTSGERPYKCKLCTHSYKQGAHLRHHVKSVHQGIRIVQSRKDMTEEEKEALKRVCGICGKILANYHSWKERIFTKKCLNIIAYNIHKLRFNLYI
jgi:hypothetical protein